MIATHFRQWATKPLREYIVKEFVLDGKRLKNMGGGNYFDELLSRIRDVRSSEKVFWGKVLDIYATSIDYAPQADMSREFFKIIQNKMHWASHGIRMGTGTGDIVKLCNEAGLTEPEFVQEEFFRVIIWRKKVTTGQDTGQDDSNLMMVISAISGEMKRVEIQENLGIRHRETLFDNYLNPAIDNGLVEMTIPDKPTSKNQRYRLTAKGRALKKKKV